MGLPPTSSKISTDANEVTTFKFDFPNFTGTHTGTDLSLGINSVAGGGTGLATLTLNNVILGNGTSTPQFVAPGNSGNVLTDNGTTWVSSASNGNLSYAQAYFSSGSSWSTTSSSFVDPTNSGGNSLTVRQSSGITLTAASSNVCGITFTPASSAAVYLVTAMLGVNTSALQQIGIRLTDGTTVISSPAAWDQDSVAAVMYVPSISGIYAPGTSSPVTVKIQIYTSGGTGNITGSAQNSVEWVILRIV